MLFHRQFTDVAKLAGHKPTAEDIDKIRKIIDAAIAHETRHGIFRKVLQQSFERLHGAIALLGSGGQPSGSPEALMDFVVSYIRHVPDFIQAVHKIGQNNNIESITTPFLRIAEEFFLSPPELVDGHAGLDALLDEAYLAHRIIEEVNDHIQARFGIPLAPMDMTKANLIVHSLIGEPFANDLDHAVQYSVEMLLMRGSVLERYLVSDAFQRFVGEHQRNGWQLELGQYPCLGGDLSVDLHFLDPRGQAKGLH